jgi:hypothetical protein
MRKKQFFFFFSVQAVLSNGQLFFFSSGLEKKLKVFFFVSLDYFSNTLWQILDEPKTFIALLRFNRKFLGKNF